MSQEKNLVEHHDKLASLLHPMHIFTGVHTSTCVIGLMHVKNHALLLFVTLIISCTF